MNLPHHENIPSSSISESEKTARNLFTNITDLFLKTILSLRSSVPNGFGLCPFENEGALTHAAYNLFHFARPIAFRASHGLVSNGFKRSRRCAAFSKNLRELVADRGHCVHHDLQLRMRRPSLQREFAGYIGRSGTRNFHCHFP